MTQEKTVANDFQQSGDTFKVSANVSMLAQIILLF